ncbi:MAG TPA: DUF6036 family nucleotidyltransferase [Polyangia bacterium]|jgi:hypothetical protein
MDPRKTLTAFDQYLAAAKLRLDAVVIGGTALNLLGIVSRATDDCDILHPSLPPVITAAARAFAVDVRSRGQVLADDWLNNGPASLANQLPVDWQTRLRPVFSGTAIQLRCLGREDLLRSKLFALCDRGIDIGDCLALAPTRDELRTIGPWVEAQDTNPNWPAHVQATLDDVAKRLGHGF